MTEAPRLHSYTFADYLTLEDASNVRHEFLAGEIYAMAGGTPEHAALSAAVSGLLMAELRGGSCRVYSSDLRIRVLSTGLASYPDVTVVCGPTERDPEGPATVVNPRMLVEVTSPSTEDYDRGEKFEQYKTIPSLEVVVFVSHRDRRVDVWERAGSNWSLHEARGGAVAEIRSLGIRLDVDAIYAAAQEPAR